MNKHEVLKKFFGYENFRDGQETLIDAVTQGRDALGIMPTGAGKSVCYQVPSIMFEGITLIISPLISLMKDQVGALCQSGVAAAYLNSSLTVRQQETVIQNAINSEYKILYVAPERLESAGFLNFAQRVNISMVTVDEAHCISQWGQDFRPHYLSIPNFIERINPRPVVSAFTATATDVVKEDIISLLKLNDPKVLTTGFDRENLYFEVQNPKKKFDALVEFLQDYNDSGGIVYCMSRKNVEKVCEKLCALGYKATRYHAGLSDAERRANQDDFLVDKSTIMVATNAFGMGIDKSNVSFVVHYNMPKDLESYYQEAGRAGRDGLPAKCILLYNAIDVRNVKWMIDNSEESGEFDEEKRRRDYARLKLMTDYSTTYDCLRGNILRYFGEAPEEFCGNCSNCLTKFDRIDVTVEAQKILSCVHRLRENYGAKMVTDVLRGAKGDKINRLGFTQLSTYNISDKSADFLSHVIKELINRGFLEQTHGDYPLLKLTSASRAVLTGGQSVVIKMPKEKVKARIVSHSSAVDTELFAKLKAVRSEFASVRGVPAFVIFSDKTLVDMCAKLPVTDQDFLEVSGVGAAKLEQFGEKFMNAIREFLFENSDKSYTSARSEYSENGDEYAEKVISVDEILSLLKPTQEAIPISAFANRINEVLVEHGAQKTSGAKISLWLENNGFLEVVSSGGTRSRRAPTKNGVQSGITVVRREKNGAYFEQNMYSYDMQKLILQHLHEI